MLQYVQNSSKWVSFKRVKFDSNTVKEVNNYDEVNKFPAFKYSTSKLKYVSSFVANDECN